jgi:hypothetical protein
VSYFILDSDLQLLVPLVLTFQSDCTISGLFDVLSLRVIVPIVSINTVSEVPVNLWDSNREFRRDLPKLYRGEPKL